MKQFVRSAFAGAIVAAIFVGFLFVFIVSGAAIAGALAGADAEWIGAFAGLAIYVGAVWGVVREAMG